MKSPRAVALLSSGLDSAAALYLAREDGWAVPLAITVDYGQRAAPREIAHGRRLAERFGTTHRVVSLPWFRELQHGGSLLEEGRALPHPGVADLDDQAVSERAAKAVW